MQIFAGAVPIALCMAILCLAAPSGHSKVGESSEAQKTKLDQNFKTILVKKKGPTTQNYRVFKDDWESGED